jgi:hypothetical protein
VLSFQPRNLEWNGEYHELEVRLKRPLRRARVFHRPGYYAPLPTRDRLLSEWRVDTAELILTAEEIEQLQVSALAAPVFHEQGRWRVPVVVEVPWRDLSPERKRGGDKAAFEIQGFAIDEDWQVHGLFASGFQLDLAKLERYLDDGGVRFFGELALLPGSYQLRLLVRNLRSGETSASTSSLSVPQVTGEAPELGSPLFVDDSGRWLLLTDPSTRQGGNEELLLAGDSRFMPRVKPTLAEGAEASLLLPVRGQMSLEVDFEIRIVGDGGTPVAGGALRWHQPVPAGVEGRSWVPATFSPRGLPTGDYRLEVRTSGQSVAVDFAIGD